MRKRLHFSNKDLYWLAGLFEGEASFIKPTVKKNGRMNAPRISINMTDEDIIQRVARLLGVSYYIRPPQQEGWKPQYAINMQARWVIDLMEILYPLMGCRRQERIREALDLSERFYPDPCKFCGDRIVRLTLELSKPTKYICDRKECQTVAQRERDQKCLSNKTEEKKQIRKEQARQWRKANPEKMKQYAQKRKGQEKNSVKS